MSNSRYLEQSNSKNQRAHIPVETQKLYDLMHKTLHSKETKVILNGQTIDIEVSNGLRYLRHQNVVFAQCSTVQTHFTYRAKQPITRIIRADEPWGWISNTEISDPTIN
jgi:hypothetical protein